MVARPADGRLGRHPLEVAGQSRQSRVLRLPPSAAGLHLSAREVTALVECGTRALVDTVAGLAAHSENSQAQQLCVALRPVMPHLADRVSDGLDLIIRGDLRGVDE